MEATGEAMTHEAMNPAQSWVLELCDHHTIRFRSDYYAFITIQEALRAKGKCLRCKLDIPTDIQIVQTRKVDY
jgi:hypothetical protein